MSADYIPTETEEYMTGKMLDYFRRKLSAVKADIKAELLQKKQFIGESSFRAPDLLDIAAAQTERRMAERESDRKIKLLPKIDAALARIKDGSYGYCEETGDPIGVGRLLARPTATLCIEEQERKEQRERCYKDGIGPARVTGGANAALKL